MKKIAVIGATGFATERMLPELQHSSTCKVISIQGRSEEKLKKVAQTYNIDNVCTDVTHMLESNEHDAVYIATPPHLHLDDLRKISEIRPSISILCEKPISESLEQAKKIESLFESTDHTFIAGHHIRHQKAFSDLKTILKNGEIGKPLNVWGQWSYELDPSAPYERWKLDQKKGGYSVMNDPGIHIIDTIYALFGLPLSVMAHGFKFKYKTTYDNVSAHLNYSDTTVAISTSQTMRSPSNDLRIYGSEGMIEVPEFFSQTYIPKIILTTDKGAEELVYEETFLYKNEMENLLGLEARGIEGTTLAEALEEMHILEAINTSLEKNQIINIVDSGTK